MNPYLKKEVKKQLEAQSTNPQKRLGQNFLVDKGVISEIMEAAAVKNSDTVLEVGPGTGNLTRELAKMAKKVIAVEKDEEMHEILSKLKESERIENVEIIREDIRNIGNWLLKIGDYKVVANIPFYLTAYLIRNFLEAENQPKEMLLVIQKEVAQRICVNPPDMNLLSVSVQFYAKPKIISYIPKKSFWPAPKVDGAIIKISDIKKPKADAELFFRIVKAGFCQPRKQILNNLANGLKLDRDPAKQWLAENGIKPEQRAETLNVEQWINLSKSFKIT
jgi:16S rRNA (adenine1518-N6/adenine1519-N6)-dimethyltransferase